MCIKFWRQNAWQAPQAPEMPHPSFPERSRSASPWPGRARPAVLTIAQPADIRSINPGVNRDNTTDGVVLHMVEAWSAIARMAPWRRCWRNR